jgi:hypothetical protein
MKDETKRLSAVSRRQSEKNIVFPDFLPDAEFSRKTRFRA